MNEQMEVSTETENIGIFSRSSDEQTESQGVHRAVAPVEPPSGHFYRIVGQETSAQEEGRNADGNIDCEEPLPGGNGEYSRRYRRARDGRDRHDRGIKPHATTQVVVRIDDAYECGIHAGDRCGTESLAYPCRHERGE